MTAQDWEWDESDEDDPRVQRQPPPELTGRARLNWILSEHARVRREYTIYEAYFLHGTERADRIAERLGYGSLEGLITSLERWGHKALAVRYQRSSWDPDVMARGKGHSAGGISR